MSAIAETRYGRVEGIEGDGHVAFRGVPFAAPPVGPRRWLPPEPPEPWSGVRAAHRMGAIAPQPERPAGSPLAMLGDRIGEESEDCLYLNVFTPAVDSLRRPVMVWIHGGGFRNGTGASPLYDAGLLARRGDVVVVTINYRLGALGFLNLNEVTGGRVPATGNEGLLDQVAALEWVRDNVAGFGGDPGNVTIFGESAGGMSVGSLLALPRARGLFGRAIPQSGACSTAHELERAARVSERLLESLGNDPADADALRAADPARFVQVGQALSLSGDREIGGMIFQPVIDGDVLPELPLEAVRKGAADGIDVLTGSTLEEWRLFAALDPRSAQLDEAGLAQRLERGPAAADLRGLAEVYHSLRAGRGEDAAPPALFNAIQTDRVFRVPAIRLAEAVGERGGRAYAYLFSWPSPALDGALGACHAIELGFVFGSHDANAGTRAFFGSGPAAEALAAATQDAWIAFARTGDPSSERVGTWPIYTPERRSTMALGEKCAMSEAPFDEEREAWSGFADGEIVGRL